MLATFLSAMVGVAALTVMVAGTRYVVARQALTQAVDRMMRCLTPTDAECLTLAVPATSTSSDWYLAREGISRATWADRYHYSGTLERQTWELRFPAFEIHKVASPPVVVTEWRVPVARFTPETNSFEYRYRSTRATVDHLREEIVLGPEFLRNFPEFDPAYEDILKNRPMSEWHPRALRTSGVARSGSEPNPLPFEVTSFPLTTLRPGEPAGSAPRFATEWIAVPELTLPPEASIRCDDPTNPGGTPCRVGYASGGDLPWQQYGYVAVKAFAHVWPGDGVTASGSADAQVKWAGSPWRQAGTPDGYGLQLETISRAHYQSWLAEREAAIRTGNAPPLPPAPDRRECLGGRTWTSLSTDRDFHLVLRGAIKRELQSNDFDLGGDAACPGGDTKHWDLSVERGGAYRVGGWLIAKNEPVRAQVSFATYVNGLIVRAEQKPGPVECEQETQLHRNDVAPTGCVVPAECWGIGAPENSAVRSCQTQTRTVPQCLDVEDGAADPFAFPVVALRCGESVDVALCHAGARPAKTAECPGLPPEKAVCGWSSESVVDGFGVPTAPVECVGAVQVSRSLRCDGETAVTYRPDGNYGDPASCLYLASGTSTEGISIEGLPSATPAPAFIRWGEAPEFSPPRWETSLRAVDERGVPVTDSAVVRPVVATRTNSEAVYRHQSPVWRPAQTAFGFAAQDLAVLAGSTDTALTLLSSSPEAVEAGYPFAHELEFEIPPFLPDEHALQGCDGPAASLSSRLRAYAGKIVPAVEAEGLEFEGSAVYRDSVAVSAEDSCDSQLNFARRVPHCTVVRSSGGAPHLCAGRNLLGRFPDELFPEGPDQCRNLPAGMRCEREVVGSSAEEARPDVSVAASVALERGREEFERHLPGAALNCAGGGCLTLDATVDARSGAVQVHARYVLPGDAIFSAMGYATGVLLSEQRAGMSEFVAASRTAIGASE